MSTASGSAAPGGERPTVSFAHAGEAAVDDGPVISFNDRPAAALMERLLRSFATFAATLAGFFFLLGIIAPNFAATFLRTLIALLTVGYVGARAYRARLPLALASDAFSPFDGREPERPLPETPAAIRGLASQLEPVDDPELRRVVPIPKATLRVIAGEATRRLAEHHGLDVDDDAAHPRIRALVAAPTWEVVRPVPVRRRGERMRDPVTIDRLEEILEDVERLWTNDSTLRPPPFPRRPPRRSGFWPRWRRPWSESDRCWSLC